MVHVGSGGRIAVGYFLGLAVEVHKDQHAVVALSPRKGIDAGVTGGDAGLGSAKVTAVEGRIVVLQGAHLGIKVGLRGEAPVNGVALKEAERLVETHLLTAVDQGHSLLHGGANDVGGFGVGADALLDGSVPGILVVVVDEVHAVAVLREVLLLALQVGIDRGDVFALAGLVEQVVKLPAVGHVALRLVGPVELGFAQKKELGILGAQHGVGLLPKF